MFLIIVLSDYVLQIPMPVLAGVMVVVCITQFDWQSFKYARTAPKKDVFVMLLTIGVVIYTHNLAIGVVAGVLVSAMFFVSEISKITFEQQGERHMATGQLFFASTEGFINYFKTIEPNSTVVLDLTECPVWDDSAIGAILKVEAALKQKHCTFVIEGMNAKGKSLWQKLTSSPLVK